ncbi:hypothetical protein JCM33374_g3899 [Metschnikowia sp. JCM 33374]|nr:hypothetical protein JCM33374_g3899 [Metschnikowia sp. JCM 33374]
MFSFGKHLGQLASRTTTVGIQTVRSLSTVKTEKVFAPLAKKRNGQSAAEYLHQQLLKKYDPTGKRTALVSGPERIRAGDVIKVTYLDRSTVLGRVLGIKRGTYNVGSNILIRNKVSKVGCEVRVPLFNPEIKNIEIVQRPEKYMPRNKQYYIRNTKYDVGDLESELRSEGKK